VQLGIGVDRSDKRFAAKLERDATIARRADEQHKQIMAGDDRRLYGSPEQID
jgi:hypothetical protein